MELIRATENVRTLVHGAGKHGADEGGEEQSAHNLPCRIGRKKSLPEVDEDHFALLDGVSELNAIRCPKAQAHLL